MTEKQNLQKGPFSLHEVWDDAALTFGYEIRHGDTVQVRGRYFLHGEATVSAWNAIFSIAEEQRV